MRPRHETEQDTCDDYETCFERMQIKGGTHLASKCLKRRIGGARKNRRSRTIRVHGETKSAGLLLVGKGLELNVE
jgi:hypothetical protein